MHPEQPLSEAELVAQEFQEFGEAENFAVGESVELSLDGRQGEVTEINDPSQPFDKQLPYNTVRVKFTGGESLLCQMNHLKKIKELAEKKKATN